MALHLKCSTPYALFLLGCRFENGVMRFLINNDESPGLLVKVDQDLPVNSQLTDAAAKFLDRNDIQSMIEINQEYKDLITNIRNDEITMYLGTLSIPEDRREQFNVLNFSEYPTMPEILRTAPKNRTRLPYLRAWQVLSGGLSADIKAVEFKDLLK